MLPYVTADCHAQASAAGLIQCQALSTTTDNFQQPASVADAVASLHSDSGVPVPTFLELFAMHLA